MIGEQTTRLFASVGDMASSVPSAQISKTIFKWLLKQWFATGFNFFVNGLLHLSLCSIMCQN
jgi:hypothetical protein